ncbi:hypothetical protein J4466_05065 [Candidatus Pacearchaeota archaeon]|nr:hypothetical protein [Candidatus Pacearchaeota archaeon]
MLSKNLTGKFGRGLAALALASGVAGCGGEKEVREVVVSRERVVSRDGVLIRENVIKEGADNGNDVVIIQRPDVDFPLRDVIIYQGHKDAYPNILMPRGSIHATDKNNDGIFDYIHIDFPNAPEFKPYIGNLCNSLEQIDNRINSQAEAGETQ